jgi:hypothetical protein
VYANKTNRIIKNGKTFSIEQNRRVGENVDEKEEDEQFECLGKDEVFSRFFRRRNLRVSASMGRKVFRETEPREKERAPLSGS